MHANSDKLPYKCNHGGLDLACLHINLSKHRVLAAFPRQLSSGSLSVSCCSSSTAAGVQQRVETLQLLQYFLTLPEDHAAKLTDKVEELVNNIFPASSWEWKRGSTQSTDYARQLMAIMDSMVAASESGLSVEPLLQVTAHLMS